MRRQPALFNHRLSDNRIEDVFRRIARHGKYIFLFDLLQRHFSVHIFIKNNIGFLAISHLVQSDQIVAFAIAVYVKNRVKPATFDNFYQRANRLLVKDSFIQRFFGIFTAY